MHLNESALLNILSTDTHVIPVSTLPRKEALVLITAIPSQQRIVTIIHIVIPDSQGNTKNNGISRLVNQTIYWSYLS